MIPTRILGFLNFGDSVVAEVPASHHGNECFVRICPHAKPGVPREEPRYLNSNLSMWEYWDFEFHRFELKANWRSDQWNHDRYLVDQSRATASNEVLFLRQIAAWVPDVQALVHDSESECP